MSRQDAYRRRTLIKARYFDEYDKRRRASIRYQLREHPQPDVARVVLEYFLNHPQAFIVPEFRLVDDEAQAGCPLFWKVIAKDRMSDHLCDWDTFKFHRALCFVALQDSPRPLPLHEDSGLFTTDAADMADVRRSIDELRKAGLWLVGGGA